MSDLSEDLLTSCNRRLRELAASGDHVDVAASLKQLLDTTSQEHARDLRRREERIAAILAFKDWTIKDLVREHCPVCNCVGGDHGVNCRVQVASLVTLDGPRSMDRAALQKAFQDFLDSQF